MLKQHTDMRCLRLGLTIDAFFSFFFFVPELNKLLKPSSICVCPYKVVGALRLLSHIESYIMRAIMRHFIFIYISIRFRFDGAAYCFYLKFICVSSICEMSSWHSQKMHEAVLKTKFPIQHVCGSILTWHCQKFTVDDQNISMVFTTFYCSLFCS